MAEFTIISDVSIYIKKILKEVLCPQYISSEESIAIISPVDKNADYQLGIYLFDIQDHAEYVLPKMFMNASEKKQYPPKVIKLKYMVYLNTKAQVVTSGEDGQKILGLVLQTLYDSGAVDIRQIHQFADQKDQVSAISLLNMALEEKTKIWTALALPLQNAIYIEVSPILIASKRQVATVRVTEAEFKVTQRGNRNE